MATSTEPIIVQIINEGAEGAKSIAGAGTGKKGSSAGGLAGISKLGGAIAVVAEVAGMIKDAINTILKPVKSVVMGILKLLAQILRPIADILLVLLIPILQFLKPIIKIFNEMMRPFRQVAMQLMAQANKTSSAPVKTALMGSALMALMEGIQFGIYGIIKEIIKMLLDSIISTIKLTIIGPLFDLLSMIFPDNMMEETKQRVFTNIDNAKETITNALDNGLKYARDKSVEKYDTILKTFTDNVDWKTPKETLASNLSGMITSAVNQAISDAKKKIKIGASTTADLPKSNKTSDMLSYIQRETSASGSIELKINSKGEIIG